MFSGIKISLQFHLWKKIISWLSSCQNILLNARRIHFQREIAIEVCILLLPLVSRDWVVLNVCWPVVWISVVPPVSQHPPFFCRCPAVIIACVHCEGSAFFSGAAEAFTFRHECPLGVEASSMSVTSPSALCVSWWLLWQHFQQQVQPNRRPVWLSAPVDHAVLWQH